MNKIKLELLTDMKNMKDFLDRHPGWHSIDTDARSQAAMMGLVLLGIAKKNKVNQLRTDFFD